MHVRTFVHDQVASSVAVCRGSVACTSRTSLSATTSAAKTSWVPTLFFYSGWSRRGCSPQLLGSRRCQLAATMAVVPHRLLLGDPSHRLLLSPHSHIGCCCLLTATSGCFPLTATSAAIIPSQPHRLPLSPHSHTGCYYPFTATSAAAVPSQPHRLLYPLTATSVAVIPSQLSCLLSPVLIRAKNVAGMGDGWDCNWQQMWR